MSHLQFMRSRLFVVMTTIGLAMATQAQDSRIMPPIIRPLPPPALNQELQLISQTANVDIRGGMARTRLTQVFQNVTGRTIEGTYVFPLPAGAAVSGFAMTVNGKKMEAEILEGDKAREIYTSIVQRMRDPAILEFIDRNLIRARIFPIAAGARQSVDLEYSEALTAETGSFRYVLPLRLPTGGAARSATVDIRIETPQGIRAVYSPTHDVKVKRDEDSARVTGEFGSFEIQPASDGPRRRPDDDNGGVRGVSDRDFVLYYTTASRPVGVNLVTYNTGDDDGYFMLLAAPDATLAPKEIAAKDVVFVCDTSGSMSGEKIEQARKALRTLLGNLNANDRFNLITFSSDVRPFRDELVGVSTHSTAAARDFIDDIKAVGGTDINEAVLAAVRMFKNDDRPHQIVFMTDGQPTVGETDIAQILKNVRRANDGDKSDEKFEAKARLFVFGVGFDVNTRLLDTLAEDNSGASDYVLPQEDIEQKVGSLYSKIAFPVLANPKIDWGGMKVYDVYPRQLPDLFRGSQAIVFGRYAGSSKAHVQLIGTSMGRDERIDGQGTFDGASRANTTLPRLWAMRKVGYLLDDARRSGRAVDGEVRDEIIRLSKRYGIVTPFTAGLIAEDERRPMPVDGPILYNGAGGTPAFSGRGGAAGDKADAGTTMAFASPGPAYGAAAVHKSKETQMLRRSEQVQAQDGVRYVEGKAFFRRDGVWTDGTYEAGKSPAVVTVKFASPEYLALLRDTKVAKWLSVGERVLVVLKDKTVRVEP